MESDDIDVDDCNISCLNQRGIDNIGIDTR